MDGILVVNKPINYTSHDVINILRRLLGTKKLGHTGTLDPDASGVLVVGVNKGTKIMKYLNNDDKIYEARVCIGTATDTLDKTGTIINQKEVDGEIPSIDSIIESFKGVYTQTPPMYSAIKYNGKRLYEYARKGIIIDDIPSRDIEVYDIGRTSDIIYRDNLCFFNYQVHASKGLYVRTLSYDIGKKCGFPAHNFDLKRVKAGKFDISESYTLEDIEKGNYTIISMSDALDHLPSLVLKEHLNHHVNNGMAISIKEFKEPVLTRIIDSKGNLLAIYDKHPTDYKMKAQNVFLKD